MAQKTSGVRRLRKIQFSPETTAGTAVSCDDMWRGTAILTDDRTIETPEEDDGWMAGGDRQYTAMKRASLSLEERDATFEELPWILGGGINWQSTGAGDGTVGKYSYTYPFGTSGVKTAKTFSFEAGDNVLVETFDYGLVSEFTLAAAYGESVRMSGTVIGREVTSAGAFYSTSVQTPTVETIYANKGQFYIDAKGGTAGTTEAPATLRDWSLAVTTGFTPVPTQDGNIAWAHHKQVGYEATLSLTMELNDTAGTEKIAWRDGTPRIIQIKTEGAALTSGGTSYTNKSLIINAVGVYETFDPMSDADGNDTVSATFRLRHDASAGDSEIIVVNNEATYS